MPQRTDAIGITALAALVLALGACSSEQASSPTAATTEDPGPAATEPTTTAATAATTTTAPETSQPPNGTDVDTDVTFRVDEQISLVSGTSITFTNAVIMGERDRYVIAANAGETMTISLTSSEDNAAADLIGPDGTALVVESTQLEIALPADGDYQVVIGGTRGNATYEVTLTIEA